MADLPEERNPEVQPTRWDEAFAFVLLALILFPLLSIILVGGFGFVIWMEHLMFGPPGSH